MNELARFLELCDEIFTQLREGQGLSSDNFSRLSKSLEKLIDFFKNKEYLPKELVGVMLDLSTALYSASGAYPEPMRTTLNQQFDLLTNQMRDLCV